MGGAGGSGVNGEGRELGRETDGEATPAGDESAHFAPASARISSRMGRGLSNQPWLRSRYTDFARCSGGVDERAWRGRIRRFGPSRPFQGRERPARPSPSAGRPPTLPSLQTPVTSPTLECVCVCCHGLERVADIPSLCSFYHSIAAVSSSRNPRSTPSLSPLLLNTKLELLYGRTTFLLSSRLTIIGSPTVARCLRSRNVSVDSSFGLRPSPPPSWIASGRWLADSPWLPIFEWVESTESARRLDPDRSVSLLPWNLHDSIELSSSSSEVRPS